MNKIPFTEVGFNDLLEEKKQLEEKRVTAVKELSIARDMGDRSENAFYKTARQKLSGIDRRLREINRLVRNAKVAKPIGNDSVQIGSNVTIREGDKEFKYLIVGNFESDLSKGRLSNVSPLGQTLLGRKTGEIFKLKLPSGEKTFEVIEISNT